MNQIKNLLSEIHKLSTEHSLLKEQNRKHIIELTNARDALLEKIDNEHNSMKDIVHCFAEADKVERLRRGVDDIKNSKLTGDDLESMLSEFRVFRTSYNLAITNSLSDNTLEVETFFEKIDSGNSDLFEEIISILDDIDSKKI
jgi:hypothetical protein